MTAITAEYSQVALPFDLVCRLWDQFSPAVRPFEVNAMRRNFRPENANSTINDSTRRRTTSANQTPGQQELRDALYMLAQTAEQQIRLSQPGCTVRDLLDDYDLGRRLVAEEGFPGVTEAVRDEQLRWLDRIDAAVGHLEEADHTCGGNGEVALQRPRWQELREVARKALHAFGWDETIMDPYQEISPGVWKRAHARQKH